MTMLLNIMGFQIGWFACVLGGAHGWPWLGVLAAAVAIVLHLYRAARPRTEAVLIGLSGLLGFVADSLLTGAGLLRFPSGQFHAHLAPYWMVAMWMLFATTFNVALGWLKPRLGLAALLGMVAGPLAYYGGAKLGGVSFGNPVVSLLAVAGVWTLAMPVLLVIANRWNGMAETAPTSAEPGTSARANRSA
ncbi:MAG: DUF2878 domain-containing protein [Candidatus Contendobacter sp.]|nr:MAG: DUF2878 domain-containing protein [Candidatus Contendobacter sp.]